MNQEIDITKITDLQLASFSIQAHIELQRAIQNVQMIQSEVARREQCATPVEQVPHTEPKPC